MRTRPDTRYALRWKAPRCAEYRCDPRESHSQRNSLCVLSACVQKVRSFYEQQHRQMTFDFVVEMEKKYLGLNHFEMYDVRAERSSTAKQQRPTCLGAHAPWRIRTSDMGQC